MLYNTVQVNVGEPLPQKANFGGSLDSLAPARADALGAPCADSPRQETTSPDPEIMGRTALLLVNYLDTSTAYLYSSFGQRQPKNWT